MRHNCCEWNFDSKKKSFDKEIVFLLWFGVFRFVLERVSCNQILLQQFLQPSIHIAYIFTFKYLYKIRGILSPMSLTFKSVSGCPRVEVTTAKNNLRNTLKKYSCSLLLNVNYFSFEITRTSSSSAFHCNNAAVAQCTQQGLKNLKCLLLNKVKKEKSSRKREL